MRLGKIVIQNPQSQQYTRSFSLLNGIQLLRPLNNVTPALVKTTNLITPLSATSAMQNQLCRSVTKFSLIKGKRKTVKAVLKRFKRLDWGGWIRTYTGRHKKMFKKSLARKRRLRQHVLVNSQQAWLLDKMVTSYWRRPRHYIDDPYAPYHQRNEFFATKSKQFKV